LREGKSREAAKGWACSQAARLIRELWITTPTRLQEEPRLGITESCRKLARVQQSAPRVCETMRQTPSESFGSI